MESNGGNRAWALWRMGGLWTEVWTRVKSQGQRELWRRQLSDSFRIFAVIYRYMCTCDEQTGLLHYLYVSYPCIYWLLLALLLEQYTFTEVTCNNIEQSRFYLPATCFCYWYFRYIKLIVNFNISVKFGIYINWYISLNNDGYDW